MSKVFLYKNFWILFLLFFISIISATAQEGSIYKEMLKESLKIDFIEMAKPVVTDSLLNKTNLPNDFEIDFLRRMISQDRIKYLLLNENLLQQREVEQKVSPYLTMSYTSSNKEPIDTQKFNGDGKFSGEFATKDDVLMSRASHGMVNVPGLLILLATKTGIISVQKKESKKEKMLRIIKEVYNIDE